MTSTCHILNRSYDFFRIYLNVFIYNLLHYDIQNLIIINITNNIEYVPLIIRYNYIKAEVDTRPDIIKVKTNEVKTRVNIKNKTYASPILYREY